MSVADGPRQGTRWHRFATFGTYPGLRKVLRRKEHMTDFSELPPSERAKRYRQLAEDALREAEQADDSVRESYLLIAEQWNRLAKTAGSHPEISKAS